MGAGAVPLSKIFEGSGTMTAAIAISIMTPAVAIGNAISIVMGGLMPRIFKNPSFNGNGAIMKAGTVDPKELEISPRVQALREKIEITSLGVGLLVSCSFFAWGYIVAGFWNKAVPSFNIHASIFSFFGCAALFFVCVYVKLTILRRKLLAIT